MGGGKDRKAEMNPFRVEYDVNIMGDGLKRCGSVINRGQTKAPFVLTGTAAARKKVP